MSHESYIIRHETLKIPGSQYMSDSITMKTLLGSYLEGGGQILRNAIVLSSLLRYPLCITDIRGNRKPSGLKPQHLKSIQWLAAATGAVADESVGITQRSTRLDFRPVEHKVFWKEHMRNGCQRRRRVVEIDIGSPGSVALLLQAVLPYVLFAGCESGEKGEIEINIRGGTNMDFSVAHPPL